MFVGWNMTGSRDEDYNYGVVKINNVRKVFFFGHIKYIDMSTVYVCDSSLHGFYKDKVYAAEGPYFSEW